MVEPVFVLCGSACLSGLHNDKAYNLVYIFAQMLIVLKRERQANCTFCLHIPLPYASTYWQGVGFAFIKQQSYKYRHDKLLSLFFPICCGGRETNTNKQTKIQQIQFFIFIFKVKGWLLLIRCPFDHLTICIYIYIYIYCRDMGPNSWIGLWSCLRTLNGPRRNKQLLEIPI